MSIFPSSRMTPVFAALCVALLMLACEEPPADDTDPRGERPEIETRADSLAIQLYDALGGPEAWAALPYLRFDFAVESEDAVNPVAQHFWDRETDDYRVEWGPTDTTNVALFNIQEYEEGTVYREGEALEGERAENLLDEAYRRFVNDTYWLKAPVKTFDEGVNRSYEADSSDADYEVLHLSFGDVGLTPGDQYWMFVDRETHRLSHWAYVLERNPDADPSYFDWMDYESLDTPEGEVYISTRKNNRAGPAAILTPVHEVDEEERERLLSEPTPQLQ